MNKLQKKSIKLYQEKIKWVKTQNPQDEPNMNKMLKAIGHDWNGEFCPYCQKYIKRGSACNCPLGNKICCCNGLWQEMNSTTTWEEWIYYAEQIIKFIVKYG